MAMADRSACTADVAAALDAEEFVRDPILRRLQVKAQEKITREAAKIVVHEWLTGDAAIPEDLWTLSGPALGRRFHVTFAGDSVTGARRAKKANLALCQSDGTWKNLYALNADKNNVKLFVGPDKSPQTEAQETLGKKFLHIIEDLYPGTDLFFDKKKFLVKANGKHLAVMVATSRDERAPKFYSPTLQELSFDKDAILAKLEGNGGAFDAGDANWTF